MKNSLSILRSPNNIIFLLIVLALLIAPAFLSEFRVNLLGKFVAFAILAVGLDLIWGYTGILSLGHGVFFGLGAYAMGMYLKMESSGGHLPDFMSWSGLESLPLIWQPFTSPLSLVFVILLPGILAFIIGYLTFRNRIRGVYFSILSQALYINYVVLIIGQQAYTGGTNGITNFTTIFGLPIILDETKEMLYYVAVGLLVLTYIYCRYIVNHRIGRILVAIRDGENRARFSGYNPTGYKIFVYVSSAVIAGIAGAIFVPQVGIISPAEMGIIPSIEMVIWVAIGGRGTLIGAVIGAICINALKSGVSESFPEIWSYFIGIAFVVFVLFMPTGIVGVVKEYSVKFFNKNKEANKDLDSAVPRHIG